MTPTETSTAVAPPNTAATVQDVAWVGGLAWGEHADADAGGGHGEHGGTASRTGDRVVMLSACPIGPDLSAGPSNG